MNLYLFHEYFHGDTGAGLGATHQTGWTGLVAKLIQQQGIRHDSIARLVYGSVNGATFWNERSLVSTSGNPGSHSRKMGRLAFAELQKVGVDCAFLDTSSLNLPMCDADRCYTDPAVVDFSATIEAADGILIAAPVYNYDVSAAAKNMMELTGEAWNDKIVGFLCAAGGQGSYMSVMAYANSLMLDFRCTIIPRFVYAKATRSMKKTSSTKRSCSASRSSRRNWCVTCARCAADHTSWPRL